MTDPLPLALAIALTLACPAAAQQRAEVIDGDTIRVAGRVIRIRGIDAPEMHGKCAAEVALAQAAAARLRQLVAGGVVVVETGRDRYRRALATIYDPAGRDLGAALITAGLARPYNGRGQRAGWC